MKNFNFINNIPDRKRIEFYKWIKNSLIIFSIFLIFISFLHFKALYDLADLKKTKKTFEDKVSDFDYAIRQNNNLNKDKEYIEKKLNKFQRRNIEFDITDYLRKISQAIPVDSFLQSLEFDYKSGIKLKGFCNNIKSMTLFYNNLKNFSFTDDVKLIHLKKDIKKEKLEDKTKDLFHEFLIVINLKKIICQR